jgi:hypothetical protein
MTVWNHGSATMKRGRWAMIALTALLAFLCQSFVTQTHLHLNPAARVVALAGPAAAPVALKAGQPSPDVPDCPICREISHGSTYLPAVPVAFQAATPDAIWRVVLPPRALAPSQYSHAWRSRAPPQNLHA